MGIAHQEQKTETKDRIRRPRPKIVPLILSCTKGRGGAREEEQWKSLFPSDGELYHALGEYAAAAAANHPKNASDSIQDAEFR